MTLLSAEQDFSERTLGALHGAMKRLLYVAGLRAKSGRYEHWGMTKTHGEEATQSAIRGAHAAVLLEVVRTPIRELDAEMRQDTASTEAAKLSAEELLPEAASRATALHLNSIILALDALARRRSQSTHRAA